MYNIAVGKYMAFILQNKNRFVDAQTSCSYTLIRKFYSLGKEMYESTEQKSRDFVKASEKSSSHLSDNYVK